MKTLEMKLANFDNLKEIMKIIHQAQSYFKKAGINQWQNNYPNETTIINDINSNSSYILVENEVILGTVSISFKEELTYQIIDGNWINLKPYVVLHRLAIEETKKGFNIASKILDYSYKIAKEKQIYNIKIDTHKNNKSMQAFLIKHNFIYCGIIKLNDGSKRLAYQKEIEE
jgi:Acetyltransferase (GNAT) family.